MITDSIRNYDLSCHQGKVKVGNKLQNFHTGFRFMGTSSTRMTSPNGNIFRVTGPLGGGGGGGGGEIHRSPMNSPHKGQWRGALMFSLIYAWTNVRVNNRNAGDLRSYRALYDVTVMTITGDVQIDQGNLD